MIAQSKPHEIIILQLGGQRRLEAMISARNFAADDKSLTFSFSGSRKANRCRITLEPDDLYTFELWKINRRTMEADRVNLRRSTQAGELKRVFTLFTGLDLNL